MSLKFKHSIGPTLFEGAEPPKPIIDGILYERNAVMLLGTEKAGKSLLAMQMMQSITTGEAFLDKFDVKQTGPVVYLQFEGDDGEFKDRLKRMCTVNHINENLFCHIYRKFCPLEQPEYRMGLFALIDKDMMEWGKAPVCIVVDSLYKAFSGDLNANDAVRDFTNVVDLFIERYNCAVVMLHHESKERRDEQGHYVSHWGDKGAYGSVYLRSYIDHILYLKKIRDGMRVFSCDTERSGRVNFDPMSLSLVEPSPLYFVESVDTRNSTNEVRAQFEKNGQMAYTSDELCKATGLHRNSIQPALHHLNRIGFLICTNPGSKPKRFVRNQAYSAEPATQVAGN